VSWYPLTGEGRSIIGWSRCGRQAACVEFSAEVSAVSSSAAGTSAIYKHSRIEQHFRDAAVLRQQGFVSESRFETVGQVALGLPPDLGFVAL
jgi:hypothetical protein